MEFIQTIDNDQLQDLRKQLYKTFTTALDGMWESLYIANSTPYFIREKEICIGYCSIDETKGLTQLFLQKEQAHLMQHVVSTLIEEQRIVKALLSSIEPVGFNACLGQAKAIEKNTLCYQFSNHTQPRASNLQLVLAKSSDINRIKSFYKTQVGFDDTFGYTEDRVQHAELFMVYRDSTWVGTGECRLSETQPNFTDVGVAVHKSHRKKGYATQILNQLAQQARSNNQEPICSTTIENRASQRAIEGAGFYESHAIYNIKF